MGWHHTNQQSGFRWGGPLEKERKLYTHDTDHSENILALDGLENGCQIFLTD